MIGALRLSRYGDASTSPEVQTECIYTVARGIGGDIVGWANDMDVSALKTTPWEREQLRHWLDRPDEWDVAVWQRMDRAVRSMADMADLGRFAKTHGKRLIFASGPGGDKLELDFGSTISELIMMFLAFAAQLEGQTIMERNRGAAGYLRSIGRWGGGMVPYGMIPVRKVFPDGNEGWWLARDTDMTWNHVDDMVRWALEGHSYATIKRLLTESGAITPWNHRARLATPPREHDPSSRWRDTTVRDILRSPTLRGYLTRRNGSIERDATGSPILQGEALVDDETWYRLQEELRGRGEANRGVVRRRDAHPLLGVIKCGVCGVNLYYSWNRDRRPRRKYATRVREAILAAPQMRVADQTDTSVVIEWEPGVPIDTLHDGALTDIVSVSEGRSTITLTKIRPDQMTALWAALDLPGDVDGQFTSLRHEYFRCMGHEHTNGEPRPNIRAAETLEFVDQEFRTRLGRLRRTEVVRMGGSDNRAAIAELREDIEALSEQLPKLRGVAADIATNQLNGMSDTLTELEKTPVVPASTQVVDLGRTWGDDWDAAEDWQRRRLMLLSAGVRVTAAVAAPGLQAADRLTFEIGTHVAPEDDAMADALHQATD